MAKKMYTSAEANKLVKKKEKELQDMYTQQNMSSEYQCSINENEEDVRPEYDYKETKRRIVELSAEIREMKHAINVFNTTEVVEINGNEFTIDEVLILLPQLQRMRATYDDMGSKLPKVRSNLTPNVIDYTLTNYNPSDAKQDAKDIMDEIQNVQLALDKVNTTVAKIELDDYSEDELVLK